MSTTRREFVAMSATTLASRAISRITPVPRAPSPRHSVSPGSILLFQGDSITDCGRNRSSTSPNDAGALGTGYPLVVAGALQDRHPERDYLVYNRGVSGNTVDDLQARWSTDTIAIRPAILSILIGVNDIWHTIMGQYHGTPEKYEAGYRALLETTRTGLPGVRLIVMEPFVLRTGAVTDAWFPEFNRYRAAARRVAAGAKATFVPLHDMLQDLGRKTAPAYWAGDGVHPTVAGHAAIARQWIAATHL